MVALDRAVEALVACDDLDEVLVDIIEVLELQFPASRAAVGLEWDGEGFGRVVGDAGCCTVLTAEATAAHPTLWEELLQAGAPLAVDDPAQLGSAFAAGAASLAAVGCWLFPFVADGSAGALVVWRTLPGPLALHHQRAIERLVRLVQLALTTHRARVALVARSHTDPLTGLANRFGLADRLSELGRQGSEHTVGLLYCDVDDFKPVNDRYGHTTGDHVLEVVARRLAGAARRDDLVARIGGDEFVVVCPGTDQGALDRMVARVRDAFDEPISADGACVDLTVSVGAAVLPEDWGDHPIDTVLDHADQALLQAKARRRRP
nr:GGDEF domain-containing protein [Rhabdothermincola salaria]